MSSHHSRACSGLGSERDRGLGAEGPRGSPSPALGQMGMFSSCCGEKGRAGPSEFFKGCWSAVFLGHIFSPPSPRLSQKTRPPWGVSLPPSFKLGHSFSFLSPLSCTRNPSGHQEKRHLSTMPLFLELQNHQNSNTENNLSASQPGRSLSRTLTKGHAVGHVQQDAWVTVCLPNVYALVSAC